MSTGHTGVSGRVCNLDHRHGVSDRYAQMMTVGLYAHLVKQGVSGGLSKQLCGRQHNPQFVSLQLRLASPLLLQQCNCE